MFKHKKNLKKYGILTAKALFLIVVLWLIYSKADLKEIISHMQTVEIGWLWLGLLIATAGQIFSALRTRVYLASIGLQLKRRFVLPLYFVGALFNVALPGGIGGDAYKVLVLHRFTGTKKAALFRVVLADRGSGLLMLIILLVAFAFFNQTVLSEPFGVIFSIAILFVSFCGYCLATRFITQEKPRTSLHAAGYSFCVQIGTVFSSWCALSALMQNPVSFAEANPYILLMFVSSIAAILPISIGGAGVREITFLYGAPFLGLDQEFSIALAFLIYVINAAPALLGVGFWHFLWHLYRS
jgi:uncharacterized membrane protein YbhN (UPF0104 family)